MGQARAAGQAAQARATQARAAQARAPQPRATEARATEARAEVRDAQALGAKAWCPVRWFRWQTGWVREARSLPATPASGPATSSGQRPRRGETTGRTPPDR